MDLIVVLGHTPLRNTPGFEYDLMLSAIRHHLPTIPVQFFGGHTHIRDFRKYDDFAHGIESGRYLETLGWINIELTPFTIGRRYIDNNLDSYTFHVGSKTTAKFETERGRAISEEIHKKARPAWNLTNCSVKNKVLRICWAVSQKIITCPVPRILRKTAFLR